MMKNQVEKKLRPALEKAQLDLNQLIDINKVSSQEIVVQGAQDSEKWRIISITITCTGLLLALIIIYKIGSQLVRHLNAIRAGILQISKKEGLGKIKLSYKRNEKEVADISKAFISLQDNLIEAQIFEEKQHEQQLNRENRSKAIERLIGGFETSVNNVLTTVSSASTEMNATALSMANVANETRNSAISVANAANETTLNVKNVTKSAEQLSSSINEISQQVYEAQVITNQATQEAQKADEQVKRLITSADRIGDVLALITDIAKQTNLLALNATIEAAQAGQAGHGFAVVANEVKNLASETAKAVHEISQQVESIQSDTEYTARALKNITGIVSNIHNVSTCVSAAIEEQSTSTISITTSIQQALSRTSQVSNDINDVTSATDKTGESASMVLDAAKEMARQSNDLRLEIASFLEEVKETQLG